MCLLPPPPPVHANATKTFSFLGTGAQPPVVSKKREGATLNLAAALGLLHSPSLPQLAAALPYMGTMGGYVMKEPTR